VVQHPVVEGLEPDADILSIHLALSNAVATPEYCVKDQTRGPDRDIPAQASDERFRKTMKTRALCGGLFP
jgi:hypothetical protein